VRVEGQTSVDAAECPRLTNRFMLWRVGNAGANSTETRLERFTKIRGEAIMIFRT
jgi:hypothetical protein